jgi:hypothetical protein
MTILMRILGNALGAAVFGGVLNVALHRYFAARGGEAGLSLESMQSLLGGAASSAGAGSAALHAGLGSGLHVVFWVGVLFAAATMAASWRLPRGRPLDIPAMREAP